MAVKISKTKGGRWTQELESGLVKLYKKFRCLWMIGFPAYNDLDRRYAAYVKIVEALRPEFRSLTVPEVVYKIRDLRYRYCVELTKIERAAACGENYTPNVPWFRVMHSFLDLGFRTDENQDSHTEFNTEEKLRYNYSGTRLTSSTCRTIYENHLKMEESKSTVGEFEESVNDAGNCADVRDLRRRCGGAEESEEVEEIGDRLGDFFGQETRPRNLALEMKMGKKMRKTLLSAKQTSDSRSKTEGHDYLAGIRIAKTTTNEVDEFNTFGTSIGSQLKTLDPELVTKLKIMILTILNEEKTKSMK